MAYFLQIGSKAKIASVFGDIEAHFGVRQMRTVLNLM